MVMSLETKWDEKGNKKIFEMEKKEVEMYLTQ
jgi:hypothetical protein